MNSENSIKENKVWTLYLYAYDNSRILGVYSSEEKAIDAQNQYAISLNTSTVNLDVCDWTLNE